MSFLKPRKDDHPKVHEAYEVMKDGRMDRREFVRVAALVGVSAGAAYAMAGIPSPAWALENSPFPADDPKAKKGGKLRVGMAIQRWKIRRRSRGSRCRTRRAIFSNICR